MKNKNKNQSSTNGPRKPWKKKPRDLSSAITLRPAEVLALYGIPTSTLCQMCKHKDPAKRAPSYHIPGRKGRKGIRLIDHAEFRIFLDRWRDLGDSSEGEEDAA